MQAQSENAPARITRRETNRVPVVGINSPAALARELGANRRVRRVKGLDVFSVTAHQAPRTMEEIGCIRETEFRREGGGTGRPEDLDRFDLGDTPYRQLVVWDPQHRERAF